MSGGPAVLPGQRLTAATYNQNVRGAWQPLTLLNSWTNSGSTYPLAQYRLVDTVTCELVGTITAGTETVATDLFLLPSGYYNPNTYQIFPMYQVTASSSNFTWVTCRTSGYCTIQGAAVATEPYFFHALISLDS